MQSSAARPDPFASDADWIAAGFPVSGPDSDYEVVKVEAVGPLTLWVEHADGVKGHVRFEESHLHGLFEPLRDPEFFKQVGVHYGAVSWPNEAVDLAPDNMHRHLAAFGEWVLQ